MIKKIFISIWLIILSSGAVWLYSQNKELLSAYYMVKGEKLILSLKLKKIDYNFKTISFYDAENEDIVFDIDRYEKKPLIAASIKNAVNGVRYRVECISQGRGNGGLLEGELLRFDPIFLDKLP